MTLTIAYDRPVKNLIAQLNATGHVTNTEHRKTHVTLHHNGARLSHEGVLQVWQIRPASAHFDVDVLGDIAQYVRIVEYAWACGSTVGNVKSISIEMCNMSLGPEWVVGEATWRAAARLAGWIFARVIGYRPTREFLVQHESWSATECAGPYIDKVYDQILTLAQNWYDTFTGAIAPDPKVVMDLTGFNGYAMQVISGPLNPKDHGENIPLGSAFLMDCTNQVIDFVEDQGSLRTACENYKVLHIGVTGRYVLNRIIEARRVQERNNPPE